MAETHAHAHAWLVRIRTGRATIAELPEASTCQNREHQVELKTYLTLLRPAHARICTARGSLLAGLALGTAFRTLVARRAAMSLLASLPAPVKSYQPPKQAAPSLSTDLGGAPREPAAPSLWQAPELRASEARRFWGWGCLPGDCCGSIPLGHGTALTNEVLSLGQSTSIEVPCKNDEPCSDQPSLLLGAPTTTAHGFHLTLTHCSAEMMVSWRVCHTSMTNTA